MPATTKLDGVGFLADVDDFGGALDFLGTTDGKRRGGPVVAVADAVRAALRNALLRREPPAH